jgi:spore germination cell wall hydrolase CwlJ-like protein
MGAPIPDYSGGATHYHATYVCPYWARSMTPVAAIGGHEFYR